MDTLPPDAARLQETLRLLVLQQRAMAGDERARAELAALMDSRYAGPHAIAPIFSE